MENFGQFVNYMKKKPRYSKQIFPVPLPFVISRLHYIVEKKQLASIAYN